MTAAEVASHLQHTNVKPDATLADIDQVVQECLNWDFEGVMVNPIWVPKAVAWLADSPIKVCTALDFPMGGATSETVAYAAAAAVDAGAVQIDVMTKVGWLRSGMESEYRDHLAKVVTAAAGAPIKAMLEVELLGEDLLPRAVELCIDAGISYVKNSSGYGGGNASMEMISRLVQLAAGKVKVKASGGIRTLETAIALLDAGADLLGASASVAIVSGGRVEEGY